MSDVLSEVRGSVGFITLNRPRALNALSLDMIRELTRVLLAWQADDGPRVQALNDWVLQTRETSESLQQTQQMGRSLLVWLQGLVPEAPVLPLLQGLKPAATWPVVMGAVAASRGAALEPACAEQLRLRGERLRRILRLLVPGGRHRRDDGAARRGPPDRRSHADRHRLPGRDRWRGSGRRPSSPHP